VAGRMIWGGESGDVYMERLTGWICCGGDL